VRVEDRIAGEHEPLVALSLSGVGRATCRAVRLARSERRGARVEIRRDAWSSGS
jgi:hypothetical protein